MAQEIIMYKDINGRDVELSIEIMKRVLPTLEKAKENDIINFALRCKAMGLNPLTDVHNATFGDGGAIIPMVKKDYYIQNATKQEDYRGYKAGIIVADANSKIIEREGCFIAPSEDLLGGWARVLTEKRGDFYCSVSIDEYIGKRNDGSVNATWKGKPATMIRKVALSQAIREAFPIFVGTYDESEIVENEVVETTAVEIKEQKPLESTPAIDESIFD